MVFDFDFTDFPMQGLDCSTVLKIILASVTLLNMMSFKRKIDLSVGIQPTDTLKLLSLLIVMVYFLLT